MVETSFHAGNYKFEADQSISQTEGFGMNHHTSSMAWKVYRDEGDASYFAGQIVTPKRYKAEDVIRQFGLDPEYFPITGNPDDIDLEPDTDERRQQIADKAFRHGQEIAAEYIEMCEHPGNDVEHDPHHDANAI